ncbi:endo-1,4-beta-xylanase [Rhodohalobacter sp. 8-1]|uniref:endo-1,4-beta-xylanase n=1 Tax=Rhodohalobacter sp. 8-1 TaxID=3131972 RepID=UPI0030EF0EF7
MKRIITALLLATVMISCAESEMESNPAVPTLKNAYEDAFFIGTALNRSQIFGQDEEGVQLTKTHFNAISPENVMKWENIHPEPGVYDFEAADRFVEFGEENDMHIVGHTLVWHSQVPGWVFEDEQGNDLSREALLERMKDHIDTVVGRYAGRIDGWDVVNEALNDDGTYRESRWYEIIGQDYLVKAFEYAREADPEAELFYNDYSLEVPSKRDGAVRLVEYLQENNAPITGIGTQGHFSLDWPSMSDVEQTITDFAALGIDVMVTELEVDVLPSASGYRGANISESEELREELNPYTEELPDSVHQQLSDRYAELFELYLEHSDDITRVTFWGITDGDSWKNNFPVRGRTNYPLLFNRQWEPKPAYDAVIEVAEQHSAE